MNRTLWAVIAAGIIFFAGVAVGFGIFTVTSRLGISISRTILGDDTLTRKEITDIRCEGDELIDPPSGRFVEEPLKTDFRYAYDVTVGDYDGDGLPDIISTDAESHTIHVFLNRGGRQFEETIIEAPDAQLMERNALGDLTGDGRANIVVVDNLANTIRWFDGDEHHAIAEPGTVARAYDVALADFDGDGLLDIAASNYAGNEVRLFRNPGDEVTEPWPLLAVARPGAGTRTVRTADFNGDGRPDVLGTARLSNRTFWLENGIDGWQVREIDRATKRPNHGGPVDLDGDGDSDVVMAAGYHGERDHYTRSRCADAVVWYENRHDGRSWQRHVIRAPFVEAFEAAAADMDGDGDLDVVATAHGPGGRVAWFENPGNPKGLWQMHLVRDDWPGGTALTLADLDGDGLPEILAIASEPRHALHIWWNRPDKVASAH